MAQPYHILVLLAMVNIQHVRLFTCLGSLKLAFELILGHFLVFLQLKKVTFHHLLQFLSSQRNIRSILVLYDTLLLVFSNSCVCQSTVLNWNIFQC
jgi:hypothetical protein